MPAELSVVIPVFNESLRFNKGFDICWKFLKKNPNWEYIFVDDGSTDNTRKMIKRAIKNRQQMKLVSYDKNQGKGYALKQGVNKAKKDLILICDIDFSTPLSQLKLLYPFILKETEVVIGSRKAQGARILKHQSIIREWLGRQFTSMSKIWLGLDVSDVTCGFKLFTKKAGKKLFSESKIKGWGYDAEILFLAKRQGFQVVDVPVTWKNDVQTKVSMASDIVKSLQDLWLIRWNDLLGRYSG